MKLTQRQLDKIAGLINEEAEVRKNLHESMYENRKKSVVQENLMFEDADLSKLPERLLADLDDEITNYSQSLLSPINKKVYSHLVNSYYDLTGKTIKPEVLMDNLEDFNSYEHEMELVIGIKAALENYILALGKIVIESEQG